VIEAIVFRTISGPVSAWESQLPPELLRLPEELARADALLDDPVFFAPYFHPVLGRPSTPVEARPAALTEQLADFLGVELLADDLDLFIQWHGESGG